MSPPGLKNITEILGIKGLVRYSFLIMSLFKHLQCIMIIYELQSTPSMNQQPYLLSSRTFLNDKGINNLPAFNR